MCNEVNDRTRIKYKINVGNLNIKRFIISQLNDNKQVT